MFDLYYGQCECLISIKRMEIRDERIIKLYFYRSVIRKDIWCAETSARRDFSRIGVTQAHKEWNQR